MSDFKVIAIRPLEGCFQKKNLIVGEYYYFYNNFEISNDGTPENITITEHQAIPDDLYNIGNIQINISAIVGKNGSGKSTIIELLIMAVNNIIKATADFENNLLYVDDYEKWEKKINGYQTANLHLSVFIKSDSNIYSFLIQGEEIKIFLYKKNKDQYFFQSHIPTNQFNLSDFFFTILFNYSHHATRPFDENTIHTRPVDTPVFTPNIGKWINSIYDSANEYKIPLILEPALLLNSYVKDYIQDIGKKRLIANILTTGNPNFEISDNLILRDLYFTGVKYINSTASKVWMQNMYYLNGSEVGYKYEHIHRFISKINQLVNNQLSQIKETVLCPFAGEATFKIFEYGLELIHENPSEYRFSMNKFSDELVDKTLNAIVSQEDLPLEIKQYFNFLKYINKWGNVCVSKSEIHLLSIFLSLKDGLNIIESISDENKKEGGLKIEYIPPQLIAPQIRLTSLDQANKWVLFDDLSSGEQQMILTIHSVLYHLIIINANNTIEKKSSNINILFEEIELYFHPEYQRVFIRRLLDGIEQAKLNYIKSINICFVTHSPFILSDIPKNNIMFLEVDKKGAKCRKTESQTFGANIYSLLKDSFFLDGFMGEFASNTIKATVAEINGSEKVDLEKMKAKIDIIGENVIKQQLLKMLEEKETLSIIDQQQKEIEELKAKLNEANKNR